MGQKADFEKEFWPELAAMSYGATHGLTIIADDLDKLKSVFQSEAWKREWLPAIQPNMQNCVAFTVPLGLDMIHEKKSDATLLVFALRLNATLRLDSEEYGKVEKAAYAINKLPGIEGKIAVALYPLGFGRRNHQEVLDYVDVHDDKSAGITHVFTVWVDNPSSFKMLAQSKTWGKWKAAYEPYLSKTGNPQQMGFCVPVEITATAAAPKIEKPKPKPKAGIGRR